MSALGDDCFFFCTSSCTKGPACPFRHVESAKTAKIICQHWQMGNCLRPMCKFRHSEFKLQTDVTEIPCYWESTPTGCLKLNCLYKHSKPRPQLALPATGSANDIPPTAPSGQSSETATAAATPVSLEKSEIEKSCPSPGKQPDKPETAVVEVKKVEEVASQDNVRQKKGVKRKESPVTAKTKADKKIKSKRKPSSTTKAGAESLRKNGSKTSTKPSVKARLGAAPITASVRHTSSSSSDSDSEDSIENIKVMSMEEIFRQKALESMMKKRAEGKLPVSTSSSSNQLEKNEPSINESSSSSEESPSASSSSSSEEIHEPVEAESSEDSTSQSSSESSDSEEESAEDFEPDVRRVVVEVDDPNLTKKKASENSGKRNAAINLKKANKSKVSSAKRQRNVQAAKKRMVDSDYDSEDDLVSCRVKQPLVLNVHDRLGKSLPQSTSPLKSAGRTAAGLVSLSKRVVSVEAKKEVDVKPARSKKVKEPEPNPLAEIKVKTLEEIKQEKLRKLAAEKQQESQDVSPLKKTTSLSSVVSTEDKDVVKKRVVLLTEDSHSEEVTNPKTNKNLKRLKKFAQKKKNLISEEASLPEKERNVLDSGIIKLETPSNVSVEGSGDDRIVEAGKKHKHKHKQRNPKKPKTERQIYVPPAMKNAERNQEPVQTNEKEPVAVSAPTAPQRRDRHPMAAVWAAGLSVSSKGAHKIDINRGANLQLPVVEKRDIRERIGLVKSLPLTKTVSPAKDIKVAPKATESGDSTQVTIKSFSEIMSEKRRRRLEMQSQKTGPDTSSSNQLTTNLVERPQVSGTESKPRVAIKPIVFDLAKDSQDDTKRDSKRVDSMGDLGTAKMTSQANRLFQKASKENNSASSRSDLEPTSHKDKLNSFSNELSKKNPKLFKRKKSLETANNSGHSKTFDSNSESHKTSALSSTHDSATEPQQTSTHSHSHRNTLHSTASSRLATPPEATVSTTVSRPASGIVHHTHDTLTTGDSEPTKKKTRLSLEDEFNFFEDENYDYTGAVTEDVEPIDDLLQDIDDLLS